MYARLWWKEARTFWPIWPTLAVVAGGVQWFLLWSEVPQARTGLLIALGLGWALLHAFAVGAGAFAAEQESNTQLFLDTLPVGRRMLWTSKVSFALATTLGLALVLAALGAGGTTVLDRAQFTVATLALGSGVLLFEGIAWSLLWSVLLGSALQAAALGLVTVGFLNIVLARTVKLYDPAALVPTTWLRLALATGALGLSWVLFTRPPQPDEGIEVPVRARRVGRRRSRLGAFSALVFRLGWETARESRTTWLLLAGTAAGLLPVAWNQTDELLPSVVGLLATLAAGVNVLGAANRTGSYRFLAQHGVRPGAVWAAKLLVWSVVLTILLTATALPLTVLWSRWPERDTAGVLRSGYAVFDVFAIGLFGQVFKRNITAWVVACLASFLLAMPQLFLVDANLIPEWSLILGPILLLAISWAWTGDWMNDQRGRARWLRLGTMVSGATALVTCLYIGYRAWSVPDIGAPFPHHRAATSRPPIAPEQDAALDYARILASDPGVGMAPSSASVDDLARTGWTPGLEPVTGWWQPRRGMVEPIRVAAAKPEARFPQRMHWNSPIDDHIVKLGEMVLLLGIDNFERRSRGDLAGAWDDVRAALRMAGQLGRTGGYGETFYAESWRTQALQWALAWAGDRRQTAQQLRSALAEFRVLPRPEPLADTYESEYALFERAIRREPEALIDELVVGDSKKWSLLRKAIAPWWERERALRVLHLIFVSRAQSAHGEPSQRGTAPGFSDDQLRGYLASTPLLRPLLWDLPAYSADDWNLVPSRAFEQVAALRIWQLEHEGHYPDTLEALVPGLLPALPLDPLSGKPFLYRRSAGQKVLPLGLSGYPGPIQGDTVRSQPTRPGQWLLYSVGPNGHDDGARFDYVINPAESDLIFPLPDSS